MADCTHAWTGAGSGSCAHHRGSVGKEQGLGWGECWGDKQAQIVQVPKAKGRRVGFGQSQV